MNDATQSLDIVSNYWRVVGVAVWVIGTVAVAVQTVLLDVAVETLLAAVVVFGVGAAGAVRSWRVRLTSTGDELTVRNGLWTRRLPWSSVTAIEVRDGLLTSSMDHHAYVGFRTEHGWVRASATLTYSAERAEAICELVRAAAAAHGVPCALRPEALRARWWGSAR